MYPWSDDHCPEAAVYIDVESVIGTPSNSIKFTKKVEKTLMLLRAFETREKITLASVHLYARRRKDLSHDSYLVLRDLLKTYGAEMFWVYVQRSKKRNAADKKIISEIKKKLNQKTLPEVLMLLSNDSDFWNIVRVVKRTSRYVIVFGNTIGWQLEREADLVVLL